MALKIATANRLCEGDVVYLTGGEDWSPRLEDARAADSETGQEELLSVGERAEKDRRVVSVYLMEVEETGGRLRPLSQRERIRARGPTVQSDFRDEGPGRLWQAAE